MRTPGRGLRLWPLISMLLAACLPAAATLSSPAATPLPVVDTPVAATPALPVIEPGQRLEYFTQTGDTVAAIAAHFNTTLEEVLAANPGLPAQAALPPGQRLEVPAYYFPLAGPAFQIIPDSEFVYGPAQADFDVAAYLDGRPGYLRALAAFAGGRQRSSAEAVLYVARNYSISPRLLLAVLEWRAGALSQPSALPETIRNPLDLPDGPEGFYLQMLWAAEQLSQGYYGWRSGSRTFIPLSEGYRSRPDMYQNAGTVGVQFLLAQLLPKEEFEAAAGPQGFARTFYELWGKPSFADPAGIIIPGGLAQPALALPFAANQAWSLTGGPHPGWGSDLPWAAIDLAPPAGETGCITTDKWVQAAADGVVVRSQDNTLVLDLDGDGLEQTGWVLFHFHMASRDLLPAGTAVRAGDLLGHPSCEGGQATGTHVHLARRYNGEWIPADGITPGVAPFSLGGWTAERGASPYLGRLTRLGAWVEACTCSTAGNRLYWVP